MSHAPAAVNGCHSILIFDFESGPEMSTDSTSIFDLSPSEKLQLVEDLWDDLASVPTNVPIQAWQLEEVERRADNLRANPAATISWEELKRNIRIHNGR